MTAPALPLATITNSAPVSILAYCVSSILMTVTNKMVLSQFDFRMNFFLLSIQSAVAVLFLWIFRALGLISFRNLDKGEAKKWLPISLALVAMIYTGSKSLQFLSIPVYTIFKNLTIILIAYGEVAWFGSKVTPMMVLSFALMVLSSIVAGWSDIRQQIPGQDSSFGEMNFAATILNINPGYLWLLLNCLSSAGYVLYMRKRIKNFNFKDFDTVYYNNMLSLPVLMVLSLGLEGWGSGEFSRTFSPDVRSALIVAIMLTGISSFFISYGSAWCVRCTSSTTYSMVGSLNKLPVAASGILFLGDPATFGTCMGILIGFMAGLLYSYSKTEQSQRSSISLSTAPITAQSNMSPMESSLVSTPKEKEALPLYHPNPTGKVAD